MKLKLYKYKVLLLLLVAALSQVAVTAQTIEWRLVKDSYSGVDPDGGANPAIGSVVFGLEMRTTGGTITDITQISVGFSYQSSKLMIPTTASCTNTSNTVISPAFSTAGFFYTTVQQCNVVNVTTGGQTFDRTTSGTLDIGSIELSTSFVRAFTITMWTLSGSYPEGGYAMINSGEGGSPGAITSYNVTQSFVNPIPANSLTYTTPLALGSTVLPVTFADFNVNCADKGTLITWKTATELDNDYFVIEKYIDNTWTVVDRVDGAGNSNTDRNYQYLDLESGAAQYRIRQVDMDGKYSFSITKMVSCQDKKVSIVMYPVPASDQLNIAIRTDKSLRTELRIFDMSGRVVKTQTANLNSGNNKVTINVSQLSAGEYIIRSSDATLPLNRKFTVAK